MTRLSQQLAAAGLALAAVAASASGTFNPAGSSGADQQLYNAGKAVFARKLACSACAYSGQGASAELARQVIADGKSLQALTPPEQDALRTYFRKRFGVEG